MVQTAVLRSSSAESASCVRWSGGARPSFGLAAWQLLGFDVDPVLSVQFSNHTGFPTIAGTRMSGDELLELLRGLEANEAAGRLHAPADR